MGRRRFLLLGVCVAATTLLPGLAVATARELPPRRRTIAFYNTHTSERLLTVYWERGHYIPDSLAAIDDILRDHRTGEVCPIKPRLLDLLFNLQTRLSTTHPFHVISGYRSPETNRMLRSRDPGNVGHASLHLSGEAIDVRLPDRPLRRMRDAALALRRGGVGYYPRSGFVHLDVGRVRAW